MNYEEMIEKLKGARLTMGSMIKLQRAVGKKSAVLNRSEAEIDALNPEEAMQHQLDMMEVLSNLIYVSIGSPKDLDPDAIADIIPFDSIGEVSEAIGNIMGQVDKTRKN